MGVTFELQNLGEAQLSREIGASIEHALSDKQGDISWMPMPMVFLIVFDFCIRERADQQSARIGPAPPIFDRFEIRGYEVPGTVSCRRLAQQNHSFESMGQSRSGTERPHDDSQCPQAG
jgi:hypothetical protein